MMNLKTLKNLKVTKMSEFNKQDLINDNTAGTPEAEEKAASAADSNKEKTYESINNNYSSHQGGSYGAYSQNRQGYEPPRDFYKVSSAMQSELPARRVGTITLGLALIAVGIVALMFMFFPNLDYITIAKLTPIIFVFLGFEILASFFLSKGQRIKYDFLSGFICFMLIVGSMGVVTALPLFNRFGSPKNNIEKRLSNEIYDMLYQQLSPGKNIKSLNVDVDLDYLTYSPDITVSELKNAGSQVLIDIELIKEYQSDDEFSKDCKAIIDTIKSDNINFSHISIEANSGGRRRIMSLSDKFQLDLDISGLNKLINGYEKEREEIIVGYSAAV